MYCTVDDNYDKKLYFMKVRGKTLISCSASALSVALRKYSAVFHPIKKIC